MRMALSLWVFPRVGICGDYVGLCGYFPGFYWYSHSDPVGMGIEFHSHGNPGKPPLAVMNLLHSHLTRHTC